MKRQYRTDMSDRDESPRRAVNPSYVRFRNPNLNNEDDDMGGMDYRSQGAGNAGKFKPAHGAERHGSPGDEFGVSDTDRIPDRSNANTGYSRPRNAEAEGRSPSPRSVFEYAMKARSSYRER